MSAVLTPTPSTAAAVPAAGPRPVRWTREEYYRLGELGFFDGKRVELVRGEVIEMSPIDWPHALGVGLVTDVLTAAFRTGFYVSVQQPLALSAFVPGSEPQPDVAVIAGDRRSYSDHPERAALVVEVANTSLFYDTTTKAELYAAAGVPEYWVVDVEHRQLLVFRDPGPLPAGLGAAAYRTHAAHGPDAVVTPLGAPHAPVKVADLLP